MEGPPECGAHGAVRDGLEVLDRVDDRFKDGHQVPDRSRDVVPHRRDVVRRLDREAAQRRYDILGQAGDPVRHRELKAVRGQVQPGAQPVRLQARRAHLEVGQPAAEVNERA